MAREQKLIKQIVNRGKNAAANELVSLYYAQILHYVRKQVNDEEEALDLTQEIFVHMLQSLSSYDAKKASFKTWLYRIATYKVVDYFRSKVYKHTKLTDRLDFDMRQESDFTEEWVDIEEAREILILLNSYSGELQQILRLKVFGDETFHTIAKMLSLPESTVKTKYYSTLRKLKRDWEERIAYGKANGTHGN
ncbi:RNA polymerase sigma factor [Bacillus sp. JCM 19041]|uniref:RNA polymerase sigma factor n=1 Tax=Bacillus sp. JCM 19041 TaxID=1460637 RepID=UPI0006D0BBFB